MNLVPRIVYLAGVVAELVTEFENNISTYRVLNGDWVFSLDHSTNEAFNIPSGRDTNGKMLYSDRRVPVLYSGPFPPTSDYHTLAQHAEAALLDDSVNDPLRAFNEGVPELNTKTYLDSSDNYYIYGYVGGRQVHYGSYGYEAVEWSSGCTPYPHKSVKECLSVINSERYPPPSNVKDFQIYRVMKKTTKVVETSTSKIMVEI